MKKRMLTMLLALILIVSTIPFAASASSITWACRHWQDVEYVTAVPATCMTDGTTAGRRCRTCGAVWTGLEEIPATGHTPETLSAVAATCTKAGLTAGSKCAECDEILTAQETIPAGHDFSVEVETVLEPTCTSRGIIRYKCSRCDATQKKNVEALGHKSVEIPATEPTCTMSARTAGEKCERCNTELVAPQVVEGTYLGHEYKSKVTKKATCTEAGVKTFSCIRCDHSYTEAIAALGHDHTVNKGYKEGYEPTCQNTGLYLMACSRCDDVTTQTAPTVDHKAIDNPGVEATCTETGLTAGTKCEYCGTSMQHRTATEALGHDFVATVTKEATCTEDGVTKFTCSRCDSWYTQPIAKLGHDHSINKGYREGNEPTCQNTGIAILECSRCGNQTATTAPVVACEPEVWEGRDATCTETGRTDGEKCKFCAKVLKNREEIPALGHAFETTTKDATCTEAGEHKHVCSTCGAWYADEIAALGHDYTVDLGYREGDEPQCHITSIAGVRVIGCSRCDSKTTQTGATIDCEYEVIPGYPATCTTEGRTDGEKCKFCGTVTKSQKKIAVLDHQYTEFVKVVTPATCTGKLVERYKCATCDATKQVWGEALGHTVVDVAEIPATCTETGVSAAKMCSVCDATLEGRDEIPALGHDYTVNLGYREGDEPQCHTTGITGISVIGCSRCDAKTAQTAPTIDCVAEVWEGRAPTCTETGRTDGEKCKFCGTKMKEREVIPALDHDFSVEFKVVKAPTCTKAGSTVFKCSRCEGYCELPVEALGHDLEELERWDPTCLKDGITDTKCKRCKLQTISRVEALGHTEEILPAVEATCTETGLTEGKKCTTCDMILEAQEEVALKDHAWAEKEGLAATCKNDGYTAYKECADCGATEGKEVIAAAHKYENFKCTVCGAGDPMCEHENAVIKHTPSTCTETGMDSFYCASCNYEFQEELPLAGHEIEVQNTPATCTAKGVTKKVCTVCQQVLESIEIPMTNHTYVNGKCACGASDPNYTAPSAPATPSTPGTSGCQHADTSTVRNPATCTTDGYEVITCNICNEVVSRRLLKALGHTNDVKIQAATCTKSGSKTVTCAHCDKFDYEVLPATGQHNYVDGICSTCRGADPNRYTKNDYQDVFVLEEDKAAG